MSSTEQKQNNNKQHKRKIENGFSVTFARSLKVKDDFNLALIFIKVRMHEKEKQNKNEKKKNSPLDIDQNDAFIHFHTSNRKMRARTYNIFKEIRRNFD